MKKKISLLISMLIAVALLQAQQNAGIVATGKPGLAFKRSNQMAGLITLGNAAIPMKVYYNLISFGNSKLYGTTIKDSTNTAYGYNALSSNTTGNHNTAIGYDALSFNTFGMGNLAIGAQALTHNLTGNHNTSIGTGALAYTTDGNRNTAVGMMAGFSNNGSNNVFLGYAAGMNSSGSNKLFIHNGGADSNYALIYGEFDKQRLRVNNKLGIGIEASTNFPLGVKGINNGGNDDLLMFYTSTGASKWHLTLISGALNFTETGVADSRLVLQPGGRIGIGRTPTTNRLEVEGTASNSSGGSWAVNSDSRLKKSIAQINGEEVLEKLLQLKGITYEWDDNKTGYNRPTGIQYGFTAQNIQTVFPGNVQVDNMGYLQAAYGNFDPMFVEALRVLNDKIKELREKDKAIVVLEERMAKLEALVKQLAEKKSE